MEKVCPHCKASKDIGEFYPRYNKPGKTDSWCKVCLSAKRRTPEHRARHRQYTAAFRARHPDRKPSPEAARNSNLTTNYRFGLNGYDEKFAQQNGACAICLRVIENAPLSVDHDHKCCPTHKTCGKCVRGLLCNKCNLWLGWGERGIDGIEILDRAKDYILRYAKPSKPIAGSEG